MLLTFELFLSPSTSHETVHDWHTLRGQIPLTKAMRNHLWQYTCRTKPPLKKDIKGKGKKVYYHVFLLSLLFRLASYLHKFLQNTTKVQIIFYSYYSRQCKQREGTMHRPTYLYAINNRGPSIRSVAPIVLKAHARCIMSFYLHELMILCIRLLETARPRYPWKR